MPNPAVDRERIRTFLRALAERFRRPARVYLVGGTTLVFERLREQSLDIDVVFVVADDHHGELIQAVRELKQSQRINVEEASPGDFIPLPTGYENRHEYIERFGQIDVFHFDPYCTALSKIERGKTQDLEDVLLLLQCGKIEWAALAAFFLELLPQMGQHSLKQDPVEFERNFRAVEQMWKDRKPADA
jgi:hypothetical protein